jgi:hypothetical protein
MGKCHPGISSRQMRGGASEMKHGNASWKRNSEGGLRNACKTSVLCFMWELSRAIHTGLTGYFSTLAIAGSEG